ncbi:hypothetical protein PoB_006368700 [Plakobranchus ocellatus]|uniref:Uncharacterized protein n=1 Tax=Plakobranchus ocellatus TaxID=259542 RepID=A0AAV4CZ49_9GAST|nr:hypothetical protein PoB_006368700 [Plakobranchus ocellatus]
MSYVFGAVGEFLNEKRDFNARRSTNLSRKSEAHDPPVGPSHGTVHLPLLCAAFVKNREEKILYVLSESRELADDRPMEWAISFGGGPGCHEIMRKFLRRTMQSLVRLCVSPEAKDAADTQ